MLPLLDEPWVFVPVDAVSGLRPELLADAFRDLTDQGVLHLSDPRGAAERFAYALLGPLQDRALLSPRPALDHEETAARSTAVVLALLRESGEAGVGARVVDSGPDPV